MSKYSSEELNGLSFKKLIKIAKELDIDYSNLSEDDENDLKRLRKKIRHAGRKSKPSSPSPKKSKKSKASKASSPKKSKASKPSSPKKIGPAIKSRYEELNKLTLRIPGGGNDLASLARTINAKYANLRKEQVILNIIDKERELNTTVQPGEGSAPQKKFARKSLGSSKSDDEGEDEPVVKRSKGRASTGGILSKKVLSTEDDDEDEPVKPRSKGRASTGGILSKKSTSSYKDMDDEKITDQEELLAANIEAVSVKKERAKCDITNDFACPDNKICNVDKNKCVSESKLGRFEKSIVYKGHTIAGSKDAIKLLKRMQKLPPCNKENNYECPDGNVCLADKEQCVDPAYVKDLESYVYKGHTIVGNSKAIEILRTKLESETDGETVKSKQIYNEYLYLMGQEQTKANRSIVKKNIGANLEDLRQKNKILKETREQALEKIRRYDAKKASSLENQSTEYIQQIASDMKTSKNKSYNPKKYIQDNEDEDQDEEIQEQDDIKPRDIEKALENLVDNEGQNIKATKEVERAVLKCLGLIG